MRHKTALLAMTAASLWAVTAMGQGGGPPPHFMHGPPMDDAGMRAIGALLHADGISDEQRAQMRAVMDSDRTTAEPVFEQLRAANQNLVDHLLATDAPSIDALDDLVSRIGELRRQLVQQQAQTVLSLRDLLTPEQLEQAAAQAQQPPPPPDLVFQQR